MAQRSTAEEPVPIRSLRAPQQRHAASSMVAPRLAARRVTRTISGTQRAEPRPQRPAAHHPRQQHRMRAVRRSTRCRNPPSPPCTPPTADKVAQLANAAIRLRSTILGLRDLDGTRRRRQSAGCRQIPDQAAEKGQAVAQYRLGTMYERGQGVAADPAKAAHWYRAGRQAGQPQGDAQSRRALCRAASRGKKDMAEAARWFSKAAALGLSDSQFNLAVLYERGDGVPQSLLDAYKWYSIAAAAGDAESKTRLGVLRTQLSRRRPRRGAQVGRQPSVPRRSTAPPMCRPSRPTCGQLISG